MGVKIISCEYTTRQGIKITYAKAKVYDCVLKLQYATAIDVAIELSLNKCHIMTILKFLKDKKLLTCEKINNIKTYSVSCASL